MQHIIKYQPLSFRLFSRALPHFARRSAATRNQKRQFPQEKENIFDLDKNQPLDGGPLVDEKRSESAEITQEELQEYLSINRR